MLEMVRSVRIESTGGGSRCVGVVVLVVLGNSLRNSSRNAVVVAVAVAA